MSRDLVSVIIPFKERFGKVERALKSVEAQTYKNVEVILVNDASEKEFNIDINSFGFNITYLPLLKNVGPGGARNAGLEKSKGEYIAFLDSDDYWQPEFLEKAIAVHSETGDLAFVYSFTRIVKNGNYDGLRKDGVICETILPDIFKFGRPWSTSSCLWTRSTVDKVGGYLNTRCWEDYDFDIRAAIVKNEIRCISEPLTNYEIAGNENLSSQPLAIGLTWKAQSLLNISKVLRDSIFRETPSIFGNFLNSYLGNAAQLVDIGNFDQARVNLDEIGKWSIMSKPSIAIAKLLTIGKLKVSSRFIRNLKYMVNIN